MDAYDIFKKLTKGLKFKHRVIGIQPSKKDLKKEVEIKHEPEKVKEEIEIKEEIEDNDEVILSHSDNESESEKEDLQIVEGVKFGEKKKKEKKDKPEDLKKKLELEEQNRFRNEHGIKAVGRHIPSALKDFTELTSRYNVKPALVDTVTQCGYTEPTPIQRQALPCMLEDRQILACAPTGSGKTAAFLLPLFHVLGGAQGGPRALILCPTRELAHQIYREALRLSASSSLRCSVVKNVKESKMKEREATIKKSDIVISTPNRLCYLLNQDNVTISMDKVRWLIIDEADKMFEGSEEQAGDFRQQLQQVLAACGGKQRRVAMFSATHTPAVAKWCRHNLRGLISITVGQRNAATQLVSQRLLYCGSERGKLLAFRQLVQAGLKPPVLVFVQSKERARQLFKELLYDGINVDVIHADRTQAQRDNVVRSFRVGSVWVLICTELMGRGIDFRGVNLVVNYDFPPSAISYIHRIGRAGRAGQPGEAVTFFTQDDVVNLRSIASVLKQSGCEVPAYTLQLPRDRARARRRQQHAPYREHIDTSLHKPDKRKLEGENEDQVKAKDTNSVRDAKNKKQRKVSNTEQGKHRNKEKGQKPRQKNDKNKDGGRKNKKIDKKEKKLNKRKKKSFAKSAASS
ncbi:probable ATP-dependent RNA helicase DDX52 isoform X2 [Papilio machaon]|uniref:probable ATP-dependent RNA helicase DDX52 isoform X2 n=1 Tax=Papilio machaon TaxID=76193 RepID=UPI001E66572F|nr:probable ATP-dependent RNA helicase DDX52 isoform X2 [Papilio machaon]